MTTHQDMQRKFYDTQNKLIALTNELQSAGQKLLKSYRESLSLSEDMFVDSKGYPRSVVATGFRNGDKFQQKSLSTFELEDLKLQFIISTFIDEPKPGQLVYVETRISIRKDAGAYYFQVGSRGRDFKVVTLTSADAFWEVNQEIAKSVMESFSDPRLDS